LADVDWNRTIRANLRHYQPDRGTVIPEHLIGFGRRAPRVQQRIVLCLDQSGSMASSVVYASVFAAALASVRSVATHVIAFDTAVVDLTENLADPVELLFGTQLGGGTDISPALAYAGSLIEDPFRSVLVLISDLYDGGDADETISRCAALADAGVQVVVLLALSDDGAPVYSRDMADALAAIGVPVFACTPDRFADLMATAIQRGDVTEWAGRNDIPLASG
jgi:Mg-chelatase subunit ChlD